MSTTDQPQRRRDRLRTLMAADLPAPTEPPPELAYKRSIRPSVVLKALWNARHIIFTITGRNLRVRYKQSVLGFAWAIITPLGLLVVFIVLFDRIAKVGSSGIPYPLFAYIALVPWTFFATSVMSGGNSILGDKALLSKAQFPREVFPLTAMVVAGVDALMALIPLGILFIVTGHAPALTTPLAILPLIVLVMFGAGLATGLAAIIVYFRDVRLALPLIMQIGLFATPVAYPLDMVPAWGRLAYCFVNPVAPVIDSLRRTVLLGQMPRWDYLGAGALTSVVVLVAGYVLFKKLEGGFADVA